MQTPDSFHPPARNTATTRIHQIKGKKGKEKEGKKGKTPTHMPIDIPNRQTHRQKREKTRQDKWLRAKQKNIGDSLTHTRRRPSHSIEGEDAGQEKDRERGERGR
jgi:hypothetical protein